MRSTNCALSARIYRVFEGGGGFRAGDRLSRASLCLGDPLQVLMFEDHECDIQEKKSQRNMDCGLACATNMDIATAESAN